MRIFPCIFPCYLRGEWFARDWLLRHSVWLCLSLGGLRLEKSILWAKRPNFCAGKHLQFLSTATCRASRAIFLQDISSDGVTGVTQLPDLTC